MQNLRYSLRKQLISINIARKYNCIRPHAAYYRRKPHAVYITVSCQTTARACEKLKTDFTKALKHSSCCYEHIEESVDRFVEKLGLLKTTGRYDRLFKDILNCNDMSNMKSLIAEAAFAYEFESKSENLEYEVKQQEDNASSVDFLWELPDLEMDIYFEQRLILQRNSESNIESYEKSEITRHQSIILSKCQNKNGELVKFFKKDDSSINIIVADNSYGISGMFDRIDCELAAYGDQYVDAYCKRGVFGFFEQETDKMTSDQKDFNKKYSNLRSIIHGILFIKKLPEGDPLDFSYSYYFTPNYIIFDEKRAQNLAERLSKVLTVWQ